MICAHDLTIFFSTLHSLFETVATRSEIVWWGNARARARAVMHTMLCFVFLLAAFVRTSLCLATGEKSCSACPAGRGGGKASERTHTRAAGRPAGLGSHATRSCPSSTAAAARAVAGGCARAGRRGAARSHCAPRPALPPVQVM